MSSLSVQGIDFYRCHAWDGTCWTWPSHLCLLHPGALIPDSDQGPRRWVQLLMVCPRLVCRQHGKDLIWSIFQHSVDFRCQFHLFPYSDRGLISVNGLMVYAALVWVGRKMTGSGLLEFSVCLLLCFGSNQLRISCPLGSGYLDW